MKNTRTNHLLFIIGFFLASCVTGFAQKTITPETALESYLENGDQSFEWTLKDSFKLKDVTIYNLHLTSQKWREFTWTHQLTVIVPDKIQHDGALLFITGGKNKDGVPDWSDPRNDKLVNGLAQVAQTNKAIVAQLRQTPNQPNFDGLTEDALISYTLHNFKKDKDYSWPLLFPMVKSAVRGMDALQEFAGQNLNHSIKRFVVSGASKRGWTTWLTGASDKRVVAIAPMVIDVLNMPISLDYQMKSWGDYSIQIEDYVKLGIPQSTGSADGKALTTMIDPYSYRKKLTMPKMIFMGTNDEYWVVDNIKNYLKDIPGQNMLHYVPNAGHDLNGGKQAIEALGSFFGATLTSTPYNQCDWTHSVTSKGVQLNINTTADKLVDVIVWTATSPDQDMRNDTWTSKSLDINNKSKVIVHEAFPSSGFKAFYVDLKYRDVNGQTYTESTRVFLAKEKQLL
ncbi:PhoPQ-activated pathogenicity-related family protein [Dyadobacter tibetensis]|uniref:PhoPQ-activated pathogenicity-related family protein n=1 Tax=Dyadobacter tibetensis TaxID=1211851 RepID=UPI00046E5A81|nr:PhoPQ-activated protein PqaA family protein [Dyadobacter tibetensis]